jgi:hypothetical protein
MGAQTILFWVVLVMAIVGLVSALLWQWKYDTERDWLERLARSLFVALQLTIWGNAFAFIALQGLGYSFGGIK